MRKTLLLLLTLYMASGTFQEIRAQRSAGISGITTPRQMKAYFRKAPGKVLISGHRGGMTAGYPENSIETFVHTLKATPAYFEIDPRLTKDSVPVLMHDATLQRTTSAKGKLSELTLREVKMLKLRDPQGNLTLATVPTLEEAIIWAKGKTILNLDKKDLPKERTAEILTRLNAWGWVMLTVHSAEEAKFYYRKNPSAFFSAHVRSKEAFAQYDTAGIPWSQFVAYVGPEVNAQTLELRNLLHERKVMVMIGTGPSADKVPTAEKRKQAYQDIFRAGFDIIESDLPVEVAAALKPLLDKKGQFIPYPDPVTP